MRERMRRKMEQQLHGTILIMSLGCIAGCAFTGTWIAVHYGWEFIYFLEDSLYIGTEGYAGYIIGGIIMLFTFLGIGISLSVKRVIRHFKGNTFKTPGKSLASGILLLLAFTALVISFPQLKKTTDQYKKVNRDQVTMIARGHPCMALSWSKSFLEEYPGDLEAQFVQVVAYAKKGQAGKAWDACMGALNDGLPFERFLAGPRSLLQPLYAHEQFLQEMNTRDIKIIHGPIVGAVTHFSVIVWVRTATAAQ
ncbi:hypothetical protein GF325_00190, partial [Candidatus Bathyarchaeota archaeon]|nr:hypothetical protein [Candidatus Bathyarchaeota archaeon]